VRCLTFPQGCLWTPRSKLLPVADDPLGVWWAPTVAVRAALLFLGELWHCGVQRQCCAQASVKIVIAEGFFQRREGGLAGAVARGDILDFEPIM